MANANRARRLAAAVALGLAVAAGAAPALAANDDRGAGVPDTLPSVDAPDGQESPVETTPGGTDPCRGDLCDEQPVEAQPPVLPAPPEVLGLDDCQGPLCGEQPVDAEPPVLRLDPEADDTDRQIRFTG